MKIGAGFQIGDRKTFLVSLIVTMLKYSFSNQIF